MPQFEQPLAGGLAGLASAFGLINGVGQLLKAKRIHPERPEYEIPEETKQMLGLRQSLLNAGMPGEQQAKQDILTSQSNALGSLARGATDQSQYLGLLGAIAGQTNNAFNNLETQRAANYQNNVAGLERAQQVMSAAKDKEWELNEYDPYAMDLQKKYQLQNAGNQNIATGLAGLTSLAAATGGSGSHASPTPVTPLSGQLGLQGTAPIGSSLGTASLAPGGANLAAMAGNGGGLMGLLSNPQVLSGLMLL